MTNRGRRQGGFTLLEVMITLAIFAICAAILLKQSGLSARQSSYLEHKTQATWIAENKLAELRLKPDWPAVGSSTETVLQSQREWTISIKVESTRNPNLRRVDVSVNPGHDTLLTGSTRLTGYLGRH